MPCSLFTHCQGWAILYLSEKRWLPHQYLVYWLGPFWFALCTHRFFLACPASALQVRCLIAGLSRTVAVSVAGKQCFYKDDRIWEHCSDQRSHIQEHRNPDTALVAGLLVTEQQVAPFWEKGRKTVVVLFSIYYNVFKTFKGWSNKCMNCPLAVCPSCMFYTFGFLWRAQTLPGPPYPICRVEEEAKEEGRKTVACSSFLICFPMYKNLGSLVLCSDLEK